MRAVLSGSAAVALVNDGEDWHSIRYEDLETLLPQREEDFVRLFHESRDLDWLVDTSLDEVRIELEDAVDSTEALSLVFDLLDRRLSDETRDAAALELDELAVEEVVIERVENVLLASPLPELIDSAGAIAACRRTNCQGTLALLDSWLGLQQSVTESCQAYLQIPVARFGTVEDRKRIQGHLIRHGVFREMAHHCLEPGGFNDVQFKCADNATLKRSVPCIVGILNDWTEPFRTISRAKVAENQPVNVPEDVRKGVSRSCGKGRELTLSEIQQQVSEFKTQIIEAMQWDIKDRVSELVDELIEFQSRHSNPEQCCMSLCGLAVEAQRHDQFIVQEILTNRAVRLKPDDAWSWIQHGKALLNTSEFPEALKAYDRALECALEYSDDVVAQNGRAEVLKAQGKLEQALEAYDLVRSQHPGDVVAQNGRAEVLKAQGKLDLALETYDFAITQHPRDIVAQTGRASLLAAKGQWMAALESLKSLKEKQDLDWIAQHVLAVVYYQTGQHDEARSILNNGVTNCPQSESRDYFRATLAQVMAADGDLESARALAEDITHARFTKSKNVLLTHILEQEQKFDLARKAYDRLPEPTTEADEQVFAELQRRVTGQLPSQIERVAAGTHLPACFDRVA
jgi:tetratricopeptide (TPR) repeat protein